MSDRPLSRFFRIFVAGAFLFSGCASINPYFQEMNLLPVWHEAKLGQEMALQIEKEMPLVERSSQLTYVRRLGSKLVAALPRREFDYEFNIVEDRTPNAFTIPGGRIYVHSGLLNFTNESELAGVLAHEIGHAYERHPAKSLSRAYGVAYLTNLVFQGQEEGKKIGRLAMGFAQGTFLMRYNRIDEMEADEIAFQIVRQSGIPADGLRKFLEKLNATMGTPGAFWNFLSSHPPTPDRIARLRQLEEGVVPAPLH